jgi:hypothetical protein
LFSNETLTALAQRETDDVRAALSMLMRTDSATRAAVVERFGEAWARRIDDAIQRK